jgi:hypothetical protein
LRLTARAALPWGGPAERLLGLDSESPCCHPLGEDSQRRRERILLDRLVAQGLHQRRVLWKAHGEMGVEKVGAGRTAVKGNFPDAKSLFGQVLPFIYLAIHFGYWQDAASICRINQTALPLSIMHHTYPFQPGLSLAVCLRKNLTDNQIAQSYNQ